MALPSVDRFLGVFLDLVHGESNDIFIAIGLALLSCAMQAILDSAEERET
jgi:hypothetical protein